MYRKNRWLFSTDSKAKRTEWQNSGQVLDALLSLPICLGSVCGFLVFNPHLLRLSLSFCATSCMDFCQCCHAVVRHTPKRVQISLQPYRLARIQTR